MRLGRGDASKPVSKKVSLSKAGHFGLQLCKRLVVLANGAREEYDAVLVQVLGKLGRLRACKDDPRIPATSIPFRRAGGGKQGLLQQILGERLQQRLLSTLLL